MVILILRCERCKKGSVLGKEWIFDRIFFTMKDGWQREIAVQCPFCQETYGVKTIQKNIKP